MTLWQIHTGGRVVPIPSGGLRIGRSLESDLHFDEIRVSRQHAILRLEGLCPTIEDLESRLGTLVDGVPAHGRVRLSHGTRIVIGTHELVVVDVAHLRRESAVTARHGSTAPPAALTGT